MKKYKNPVLMQSHLDKAESAEAKEQLHKLETDYQNERKEQEEILFVQDRNFYQGLKDGLHVPSQEQGYLDYKDDRRLRLKDKYLSEGDKTLEHYQPEQFEQIHQQEQLDHQEEVDTAKTFNDGYFLEKHAPELAQKLRENIGDITQRGEQSKEFVKGQELSMEERSAEKEAQFKDNAMELSHEAEQDLTIEEDIEPDLEINDDSETMDNISPDRGISLDKDD